MPGEAKPNQKMKTLISTLSFTEPRGRVSMEDLGDGFLSLCTTERKNNRRDTGKNTKKAQCLRTTLCIEEKLRYVRLEKSGLVTLGGLLGSIRYMGIILNAK